METLFNLPAEIKPDGTIKYDKRQFKHAGEELSTPETRNIRIVFVQEFKDFTKRQLSYYHGFLLKDVQRSYNSIGCSMTLKEADELMRGMFLFMYKTDLKTGRNTKVILKLDSTTPNPPTTKQMSVFFEDIVMHCAVNMSYVMTDVR